MSANWVIILSGLVVLLLLSGGINFLLNRQITRLRDRINRQTVEIANLRSRRPQVPNYRGTANVPGQRNAPPTFVRKERPNFPVLPPMNDARE